MVACGAFILRMQPNNSLEPTLTAREKADSNAH
jgi:hypothetical protein